MSRFGDSDGEGVPWEMWNTIVSRALGGRRGQEALAELEAALLELPAPRLVEGHLAADGAVCAVGAFVAHRRAQKEGVDIATVIDAMAAGLSCWCGHGRGAHEGGRCSGTRRVWRGEDRPCSCDCYEPETEDAFETANAGRAAGMTYSVAWHLAWLNDEEWADASPEERYERMLAWVRRAQGKPEGVLA